MQNASENTRRLAKNTILLSLRSLFNLFCSLYSSRLFLQALGVEDYGIYNAVAGFVSMFWLVTGSLSSAVGRFITVELGRGDRDRLNKVFSMSLIIMACFGLLVLILTESFGLWFLQNKMTITPGREKAALWVFQISVISIMTSIAIVPFGAEIIAHEKMGLYAYTGIAETLFRLLLAIFLVYGVYSADSLILYAAGLLFATLSIQIYIFSYCCRHFQECRARFFFKWQMFKEMFSYAGWNFVEQISQTFSGQGVNMAINVFLGPVLNSARGLAGTVENVVTVFVRNFTMALSPQITKSYAAGKIEYMKMLAFRGAKFSYFILLFLALPLFLEADFALSFWLAEVPPHTVNFVRISLLLSQLNIIDGIFRMMQDATQNIKCYKIPISIIVFCAFPLSYLCLKLGMAPEWIYIIMLILAIPRIFIIQKIVAKTYSYSLREKVWPLYLHLALVTLCAAIIPVAAHFLIPYGWGRTLTVGIISLLSTATAAFFFGCNFSEKQFVIEKIIHFRDMFFKARQ